MRSYLLLGNVRLRRHRNVGKDTSFACCNTDHVILYKQLIIQILSSTAAAVVVDKAIFHCISNN